MNTFALRMSGSAIAVICLVAIAPAADVYPPPEAILPGTPPGGGTFDTITASCAFGESHTEVPLPFAVDLFGEGAGQVILVAVDPMTTIFPPDPASRPDLWSHALIFTPGSDIADLYCKMGDPFSPPLLAGFPTVYLDENSNPRAYDVYGSAGEPLGTYEIGSAIPAPSCLIAALGACALVGRRRRGPAPVDR